MGYFIRNIDQINKRFSERLTQVTDITYTGEGSLAKGLLQIIGEEMGDIYAILDYNTSQCLVSTAMGLALDSLGFIYATPRKNISAPADQNGFYFYLNTSDNHSPGYSNYAATGTITIPAGTSVSTHVGYIGDELAFTTKSNVVFSSGESIKYIDITPTSSTYTYDIGKHKLNTHSYTGSSSGIVYCTNPKSIILSQIKESDDQYRERILANIQFNSSSNATAIRIAALNVDHVRDVAVEERIYGPGTGKVVIDVDSVGNETNAMANVMLGVEEKKPFGSAIVIALATKVSIDITYTLSLDNSTNQSMIESLVANTFTSYINSLKIGDVFYVSKLIDRAMDVSTDIRDIMLNSILVGGSSLTSTKYIFAKDEVGIPGTIASTTEIETVY